MSGFNIDEIEKATMSGLKDFQRATVERVDSLYRTGQNRVLVADEVGMGKTLVARGVIVKAARLRIEEQDDLFKVVYICSNQTIANQNIRKLDITDGYAVDSVADTRLSMQHLKIAEQENSAEVKDHYIQLMPLTPETSFHMTAGGGSVNERALMFAILRRMEEFQDKFAALDDFMRLDALVSWDSWAKQMYENRVRECETLSGGNYPANVIAEIRSSSEFGEIIGRLDVHLKERCSGKEKLTVSNSCMMSALRVMFARISVSMLHPDLVIMDEFQRFKFLLSSSDNTETGLLAQKFLTGQDTRVLLLSATPYKLYSTMEEIEEGQKDDEAYEEFYQVMNFLFEGKDYTQARKYYRLGALEGDALCFNQLGVMYAKGQGVKEDIRAAFDYYLQAAEMGDTLAYVNVGWCYEIGATDEPDLDEALKYYQMAAEQGEEHAIEAVARLSEQMSSSVSKMETTDMGNET